MSAKIIITIEDAADNSVSIKLDYDATPGEPRSIWEEQTRLVVGLKLRALLRGDIRCEGWGEGTTWDDAKMRLDIDKDIGRAGG